VTDLSLSARRREIRPKISLLDRFPQFHRRRPTGHYSFGGRGHSPVLFRSACPGLLFPKLAKTLFGASEMLWLLLIIRCSTLAVISTWHCQQVIPSVHLIVWLFSGTSVCKPELVATWIWNEPSKPYRLIRKAVGAGMLFLKITLLLSVLRYHFLFR